MTVQLAILQSRNEDNHIIGYPTTITFQTIRKWAYPISLTNIWEKSQVFKVSKIWWELSKSWGGGKVVTPYSRCFVRKGMPVRSHQLTLFHQGRPEALSLNQILCNKWGGIIIGFPHKEWDHVLWRGTWSLHVLTSILNCTWKPTGSCCSSQRGEISQIYHGAFITTSTTVFWTIGVLDGLQGHSYVRNGIMKRLS